MLLLDLPDDILSSIVILLQHRDTRRVGMACRKGRSFYSLHYKKQLERSVSLFISEQRGPVSKQIFLSSPFIMFRLGGMKTVFPEVMLEVLTAGYETVILDLVSWETEADKREKEKLGISSCNIGDNLSTRLLFCACGSMCQHFMVKTLLADKSLLETLSQTKRVLPKCNITYYNTLMRGPVQVIR